ATRLMRVRKEAQSSLLVTMRKLVCRGPREGRLSARRANSAFRRGVVLNLLTDAWLPVIRRQSGRCIVRPAQIAATSDDDAVVSIDWPRPDFRIATMELLIGLLATAFPPEDEDIWLESWHEPPEPGALDEAFAPFAHAFDLDGDGPRFLQDLEDLKADAEPV